MQQCRQSEVTAQPQCASSSISSSSNTLNSSKTSKYLHTRINARLHHTSPPRVPLRVRCCLVKAAELLSLRVGLFVTDTDTRDECTFLSTVQPVPTKPPHWEDSAVVTGGVNRRGGVTQACECARFIHRPVQERITGVGWVGHLYVILAIFITMKITNHAG